MKNTDDTRSKAKTADAVRASRSDAKPAPPASTPDDAGSLGGYLAKSARANAISPRHYFKQHAEAVFGPAHRALAGSLVAVLKQRLAEAHRPGRVESFEAARQRLGLTEPQLREQQERFKNAHLAMFLLAGALLAYAFWLASSGAVLSALGALILAAGGAVHGYLCGFRAWQIVHRQLLPLRTALRIPSTYLVL